MSSTLAEPRPVERENPLRWARRVFRDFRRSRPFWGGLLAVLAGVPIMYFPYANLSLNGMTIAMATTAGAGSLIIGVLLVVLGLTGWFQPVVRVFAGIATTLLTLVSIPVSNLGGFGLSILPGLIGGGLMIAWAPLPEADPAEADATASGATAADTTVLAATAAGEPAVAAVADHPSVEEPAAQQPPAAAGETVPAQQAGEPKEIR
ncbi:DUF6114 domain-containing protein [Kitasatospora sp. NPDC058115]|uniref:DUF6114 domain-containing protein n=1 Tax=Kitasatospora sp. NPDC058115 TaxID=3346347 RepID=UPI0036D9E062